jgi:nickel-dependent lactate racemase
VDEPWDAVLSIGQLVPHEVIGIANHVKNVLVGVGGADLIHKSHWVGAVYGMERVMGRAASPVRAMLDWAAERFLAHIPITYILTVRARNSSGELITRGLYAGEGTDCFHRGAELCRAVNLDRLPKAPTTVVCHMDPDEFHSTWVGNKAIYRTRMAIADAGELVILAPGVKQFGEDAEIDRLIRRYGYRTTPEILDAVAANPELQANLSAAAHLIHGSPENRFRVTYCAGHLSRAEVEGVGFGYRDLADACAEYNPAKLVAGWNTVSGKEVYYIPHPALGLWGTEERFR